MVSSRNFGILILGIAPTEYNLDKFRAGYDIRTIPIKSSRTLKNLFLGTNHKRGIYITDLSISTDQDIDLDANYFCLAKCKIPTQRSRVCQKPMYVGDMSDYSRKTANPRYCICSYKVDNSFSYSPTNLSAPHSLKIDIARPKISFDLVTSPIFLNRSE